MADLINDQLTDEQKRVLFEKGTEAPFAGEHLDEKRSGMFKCVNCGSDLFTSDAKFDSGSGWPSFDQAIPGATKELIDSSHGLDRTEVVCANCNGHLGHVFPDGPVTTGQRYCVNGTCLAFTPKISD